jgi:RHS repeat-associated protein
MTPEEMNGNDNRLDARRASAATHATAARRRARATRTHAGDDSRGHVARNFVTWALIFMLFSQSNFALAGTMHGPTNARAVSHTLFAPAGIYVSAQAAFASATQSALDFVSGLFSSGNDNNATPEAAPAAFDPAALAVALPTPTPDAAISRHYPSLNGGRIEGNLRVNSGENIAINSMFQLTGDLYTVGTPNIIVNSGASYGGLVDDGGTTTPTGYPLTLNSGFVMPGKIHKRANALTLPTMPSVPAASGTRTVNINTAADVSTIGTWSTVKDLNVTPGGLTINVPPGNYGTFSINGTSQLKFTAGTYNFAGTINLNAGSTIQTTGAVTINIAQNFNLNGGFVTGTNTQPGDVLVNIIGTSCSFNNASSVTGSVRAPNANVNFNGTGTVTGQVIANYLNMNGGKIVGNNAVTPPPDTTQPTIAITSPANNSTTTSSSITVTGTAADPGVNATGIASVTVNNVAATYTASTGQWTLANVALALGANTLTARATDVAGNQTTVSVNVTRQQPPDTQAPAVAITSPANNSTTTASSVTVSGTVSDTGTNASGVSRVMVNGTQATITGGNWTIPNVALNLGSNTITATAFDNANNQSSATVTVTRQQPPDATAPTVTITSPANNSTTQADTITITGTASDPGSPSSGISQVTVNGQPATYNSATGNWTINVALTIGANTITARAYDNANNQASASITVTRQPPSDTQAPQVAIASPANNSTTIETSVNVSGTASDPGQYQSGVTTVTVNGVAATYNAATGQWTAANIPVSLGANTITATATDGAGNHTDASITVTRQEPPDTQAPDLSITSPSDGSSTDAEAITVSGTVADTGSNASGVAQVTVNGMPANVTSGAWTLSGVALTMGSNTITVRAYDNASNQTVKTVSVTRVQPPDTTAPNLTVSEPADNSTTDSTTTSVSGTVSDTGANASGVAGVTVNGAAAQLNAQTGSWTFASVALTLGANTITVRATDHAGNEAVKVVHVTRVHPPDTQPPTLTITSPADGSTSPDETITVTGTATDEGVNAAGVRAVTVNGVAATYDSASGNWSATGVALNEGPNTITVIATDSAPAANSREATINVTRRTPDRDAPTVTITSPAFAFETYDALIDVAGTATDDGLNATGVVRVVVNGRQAQYDSATKQWSISGVALSYGDNTITAVATDGASPAHDGSATLHVTRNRIPPPTLNVTNPQNGGVYAASTITVAGTVSSLSTDPVVVKVNGETASVNGGSFTKTVALVEGSNTINVVATDSLNQEAQSFVTILRDQTAPVVSFVSPPLTVQPGASYQITVEATDNVGVAAVEFSVNGAAVGTDAESPYVFTLNVPAALAAGNTLTLSAVARDLSGTSATATAQARTTGPGGISGYAFDDATGYTLEGARAAIAGETNATTDASGTYGLVSNNATGVVRLTKDGYTPVERIYNVSPSEGAALFDARLTPLDSHANQIGAAGGSATGDSDRMRLDIAAGSLPEGTDVRLTSVSPQGLANLLPYGWSPVPGGVVDVRAGSTAFQTPAHLRIARTSVSLNGLALALVRYDEQAHGWRVVAANLSANADGSLEADITAPGQYAFLVADQGTTAPPPAQGGQLLTSSSPADSAALDAATASAVSTPRVATYSAQARATVSFVASAPTQLPSGVAIEASFGETYNLLGGKDSVYVDRPQQDFILYAFPSVSPDQPNRLGASFIAKPTRTDFSITDLLGANVHVEIRSGRQSKTGVLVGQTGGTVRAGDGATLQIAANSFNSPQPVFFESASADSSGLTLPEGYEIVGVFDVNLSGGSLTRGATISIPLPDGDNSRVVAARVLSLGGRLPQVVARAIETDGRLATTTSAPTVPSGVTLKGIVSSGRYVFIRVPRAFGYVSGTVADGASGGAVALAKVYDTQTPFVDVTGADGRYTLVGAAGANEAGANQLAAESLQTDATGATSATLASQDATVVANISVASVPLRVVSVSPADNAGSMIVTTPVTVTFNKPVTPSTLTASAFKLTTSSNNPVLGAITVLAGNRVAVLTPQSTLAASTRYVVSVAQSVRDTYGHALEAAFSSSFTTAAPVTVANRLRPELIRIDYPNEQGMSHVTIPAHSVPDGSTILVVNTTSGATVTAVSGSGDISLQIPASVGDEVTLTIRQPDGTEYTVSQGAYRRADGFTSVGANGGAILADDGASVLNIPAGAISGIADIKMTPKDEAAMPLPRTGEMAPDKAAFGAGIEIRAEGNFTNEKELHLELPAPAGVAEGTLAAFVKPSKVKDDQGNEVEVWEAVTSGRVVNGKFKTNSPPFFGLYIGGAGFIVEIFALMPTFGRAVFGKVTDFTTGKGVAGASVLVGSYDNGWFGRMVGRTHGDGEFALFEFAPASANEGAVPIKVFDDLNNRAGIGTAVTGGTFEDRFLEGLSGFASFRGNVVLPAIPHDPLGNPPPGIQVTARSNFNVPIEQDTLYTNGVATVGTTAFIIAAADKPLAQITGSVLVGGVATRQLTWREQPGGEGRTFLYSATIDVTAEGSFNVTVKGSTRANDPLATRTVTYNFVGLRNPNTRPPLEGPPSVIHVTPADGAENVELTTDIRIEFSEPVKNLIPGQTIYVQQEGETEKLGGTILSGGVTVQPDTPSISSIVFKPTSALAGGKKYTVYVTPEAVDATNDGIDQNYTGTGDTSKQPFNSSFETFGGLVLTQAPIPETSSRIRVVGQYAYTVKPFTSNNLVSRLTVYDVADPQAPVVRGTLNVPQRAFDLDVSESEEDAFNVNGRVFTRIAAVITSSPMFPEQSANVWFISLDDVTAPEIIGVTSLYLPLALPSNPLSVRLHKGRAYVGSSPYRGISVVDVAKSARLFAAGLRAGQNPILLAVKAPMGTTGIIPVGFGMTAKVQTVTVEQEAVLSAQLAAPSLDVMDQFFGAPGYTLPTGIMPSVYVANNSFLRLLVLGFPYIRDNRNGLDADGKDDRLLNALGVDPRTAMPSMVRLAKDVLVKGGQRKSLAVMMGSNRLWIFDASVMGFPVQYPSKAFADLGIQGSARYFDIEGSLAYVIVDNDIVVIDFSDPANPRQAARLTGVGTSLRALAVKDGFIYSLSPGTGERDGLNVSIALPTSTLYVAGSTADPASTCAGPVVLDRTTNVMKQGVSVYFQVFGRKAPLAQRVIIRKGEQEIASVPATLLPSSNDRVAVGHAEWMSDMVIDRTAQYTAELALDENATNEYHSLREPIPFSYLIENHSEQMTLVIKGSAATADEKALYGYVLGAPSNVTLTVNGNSVIGGEPRGFGINVEQNALAGLGEGRYPFTLRAEMIGAASVNDQITGTLVVLRDTENARPPGHTLVGGVDIASGNLAVSQADVPEIKNRGIGLSFVRSYNSVAANSYGPLGYGWQHNYVALLTFRRGENGQMTYQLRGGDGSGQSFKAATPTGFIVMQSEKPYHGILARNADGSFDYYTTAHTRHHFPGALEVNSFNFYDQSYMGNLEYIQEPNGNKLVLDYDEQGRMTSVTDSSGRALEFTYEAAPSPFAGVVAATNSTRSAASCVPRNQFRLLRTRFVRAQVGQAWRITEVKGPGGLSVKYRYDEHDGNLLEVTRKGTDDVSAGTGSAVWEYEYKPEGSNPRVETAHLLKLSKNPNGATTTFDYALDMIGGPVKTVARPEVAANIFTYTLDANNRIRTATVTDGAGAPTAYTLTADGYTTNIVAPLGAQTTMEFNAEGLKTSEVDPLGLKTTYEYDLKGNPRKTTHTGADGAVSSSETTFDQTFSKPLTQRDANGNVTSFTLDGRGNITSIRQPTGASQSFNYRSNGDLASIADERGLTTRFTYDQYGNTNRADREVASGSTITAEYVYDIRSRMTSQSDTLRPTTTRSYDALDRVVSETVTDPTGFRDALTSLYTYNAMGQVLTAARSGGGQTLNQTYTYDGLERTKTLDESASGAPSLPTRTFAYDGNSNLLSETDRRGVTATYEYNALNFRTSVRLSGPFGSAVQVSTIVPDKVGNPISTTDQFQQPTTYTYDGLHRLRSRALPGGYTEEQTLDGNGNILSTKDRNGRLTTVSYDGLNRPVERHDPAGRTQTWTYDDSTGTVTRVFSPQNLTVVDVTDSAGRPTRHAVSFGSAEYVTRYSYAGRMRVTIDARGTTFHEDLSAFGEVGNFVVQVSQTIRTETRYGAFGGVKSSKDANDHETAYALDGLNRPVSASHDGGFTETWSYDGEGLVLSHADRRGATSAMTYDNLRRPLTVTASDATGSIPVLTAAYNDASHTETRTDANSHPTVFTFDGLSRISSVKDADNKTRSFEYDGMNLRRESDFKGAFTSYQYDPVDRVIEVRDRAGQATVITHSDAGGYTKTTTDRRGVQRVESFDAMGRLTGMTDGGQPLVSYEYDANNNRTAMVDGRNNRTAYQYDELNRLRSCDHAGLQTESYAYDAAGNVTKFNDGRGRDAAMTYDELDHMKTRTDGEGNTTTFRYDGGGLLLEKTEPKGGTYNTAYEYNALGSLVKVTDGESRDWRFAYDGKQNLKSITDARSNTVSYEYDALDRLLTVNQPQSLTTVYGYDANSNRTSVRDAKGQQFTLGYDALDRLTSDEYADIPQSTSDRYDYTYDPEANLTGVRQTRTTPQQTQTRQYATSYDARRRVRSQTDEYGKTVSYEYDAANNLTRLTDAASRQTTYTYDARNRLQSAALSGGREVDFQWYADGLLKQVNYGSHLQRDYTYDDADRVTRITNTTGHNGLTSQVDELSYTYDANSNRETETRTLNNSQTRTVNYQYDHDNRLTQAMIRTPGATPDISTLTWHYDAVGNRDAESGNTTDGRPVARTYLYDSLNRLTQVTDSAGGYRYEYDANGNLVTTRTGDGQLVGRLEYDARDQMRVVKDGQEQELARYDYDYMHRRTLKSLPGDVEQRFVYDGTQVLDEFDKRGQLLNRYDYGAGLLRGEFANEGERFFFSDAVGSTTSLSQITQSGQTQTSSTTASYNYDAWGAAYSQTGASANQFGFTGQRLDPESGLMALGAGARYYAPGIGRFVQQDSFAGVLADTASLNRYSYAHNSPAVHTDPSGHLIPLLIAGLVLLAINVAAGYYRAEARRLERGLTEQQAGNSLALGLSDATGMTSLFNGVTGQDAYTGRDLSKGERILQTLEGGLTLVGTATMGLQLGQAAWSGARTGLTAFSEAGGGMQGVRSGLGAVGRQFKGAVMSEAAGTMDELTNLRPFSETRFGRQLGGTRMGRILERGDDLARSGASQTVEAARRLGGSMRSLRDAARNFLADETGSFNFGGGGGNVAEATPTGSINYGSLDRLGRPTGVQATITEEMIGTGTPANPSIQPPGWSGNGTLNNEARGHLLGRQLGGSGDVPENLVTLQQNPANSPFMRGFENQVRRAVEAGETVRYTSTPIYNGANLAPRAITLSARGSNGFSLDITILNPL